MKVYTIKKIILAANLKEYYLIIYQNVSKKAALKRTLQLRNSNNNPVISYQLLKHKGANCTKKAITIFWN